MPSEEKNIRILTNVDSLTDKHLNIKLQNTTENVDILSLRLKQSDIYTNMNSNYGCLIGRVESNGLGLPNSFVSVFIPISESEQDPDILGLYPFENTRDIGPDGKKYNLLKRLSRLNPFSGFKENNYGYGYKPKTPNGSFPDKVELLCNNTWKETYKKYYKYTTVTNQSGDYMIMGVPTGSHTVHVDVDITDIGKYSTSIPILSQVYGLDENLFNNEGTKVKQTNDLNEVPTLFSQDKIVNVRPFWGDKTLFEIGITRADFNIRARIVPPVTITGAGVTPGFFGAYGDRVTARLYFGFKNLCLRFGIAEGKGVTECNDGSDSSSDNGEIEVSGCGGLVGNTCLKNGSIPKPVTLNFGIMIPVINTYIPIVGKGCQVDGLDVTCFRLCFNIVIPNIIPFIKLEIGNFSGDGGNARKHHINGGRFNEDNFVFKYLGGTSCCGSGFDSVSSDELTDNMDWTHFRIGEITPQIFAYKQNAPLVDFSSVTIQAFGRTNTLNTLSNNIKGNNKDIIYLREKKDYALLNNEAGKYIIQIPCNRRRVITDELGNEVETDDATKGVPTQFAGYIIYNFENLEIDKSGRKFDANRVRIKIPQYEDYYRTPTNTTSLNYDSSDAFLTRGYFFEANEIYTTSQFINGPNISQTGCEFQKYPGILFGTDPYGVKTEKNVNLTSGTPTDDSIDNVFSGSNLVGTLVFWQYIFKKKKKHRLKDNKFDEVSEIITNPKRTRDNSDELSAGQTNSRGLLSGYNYSATVGGQNKVKMTGTYTNFVKLNKDYLVDYYSNIPFDKKGIKFETPSQDISSNENVNFIYNNNSGFLRGLYNIGDFINYLVRKDVI